MLRKPTGKARWRVDLNGQLERVRDVSTAAENGLAQHDRYSTGHPERSRGISILPIALFFRSPAYAGSRHLRLFSVAGDPSTKLGVTAPKKVRKLSDAPGFVMPINRVRWIYRPEKS